MTHSFRKDLADAQSGVADSFVSFSFFLFIILAVEFEFEVRGSNRTSITHVTYGIMSKVAF